MNALCSVIAAINIAATIPNAKECEKLIPDHEWDIIVEVAHEYKLTATEFWLLAAIRRHENGLAGLEFGVGGPMNNGHPAHRFALNQKDRTIFNERSFRCQAQWAAGTIRKRFNGNYLAFARRYCSANPWKWYTNVMSLIARLQLERGIH